MLLCSKEMRMSDILRLPRVQSALKRMLLFGLGIFLLTRITSGTLDFYISQRFAWLTILAILGLFLVGGSYRPEAAHAHAGAEDDHHHSYYLGWAGLALIALPIILGLFVPPRPLGVAALDNREISVGSLDSVLPAAVRSAQARQTSERSILDWVLAFHEGQWPAETDTADVIGFVYHSDNADENYVAPHSGAQNNIVAPHSGAQNNIFTITRFVVGCCAADAMAVGLTVQWPDAPELVEDQWVRVVGRFTVPVGNAMPVLVAEQVNTVPEPNQPYLYP